MPALYLDTSALVKLVQIEAESDALRTYLQARPAQVRVTGALSRAELLRAVWVGGPNAQQHALAVLEQTEQVVLTRTVLDHAGALLPGVRLRTLDAIHLACALTLGTELQTLITYDLRLRQAAEDLGLTTFAPT